MILSAIKAKPDMTIPFENIPFPEVRLLCRDSDLKKAHGGRLAILEIRARDRPFSSPEVCHNQTDPLVPPTTGVLGLKPHLRLERRGQDGQDETQ